MAKKNKTEEKDKFWWIFNQEEIPVAVSYAKTQSGALARFEYLSGEPRADYRAEEMKFTKMCAWTGLT